MPKRTKGTEWRGRNALEFLRGGKTVPDALLSRRIADVKRSLAARYKENRVIEREAAKYWSQIQKPTKPVGNNPQAVKALDGLLGIHKKLAKQKLAAPKVPGEVGGIFPGRFGAKITPPFDYAYTLPFPEAGNTSLLGSADKNTGQLSGSAITDFQAPNEGGMYTEIGIYFRPMSGPAVLRVSASPAISIEWWTNSLKSDSTVVSIGSVGLGIWAQQGIMGPTNSAFAQSLSAWDEESTQQVLFDFGSNPHEPLSVQLEVDPSFSCLLFVATDNHVQGVGWPGSLAGSMTTVALPSITFELDLIPVATTG